MATPTDKIRNQKEVVKIKIPTGDYWITDRETLILEGTLNGKEVTFEIEGVG